MSVTGVKSEYQEDDEIVVRLSDIIAFIKNSRRQIIIGALIGFLLGILYAFSKQNMYKAQVAVMPEIQTKNPSALGGLSSLAGLAGLSIDNIGSSEAIRPDLYPNVLQSIPFALNLLKKSVYSQKIKQKQSLEEFIVQSDGDSFTSRLADYFPSSSDEEIIIKTNPSNSSQAIQITKKQDALIKLIQASVSAIYDKKTGILTILSVEPDPVVAADVAQLSLDYLTDYVITYRTEKARAQVNFLEQRVKEAENRYKSAQYALSNYRDKNRNLFLNTAKIEEQRLQADYLLEQSVYNELSKQLEQAKIKVQEETPVFKVLEPPTVPLVKTSPKRTLIIIGFTILGIIFSLVIVLIKRIQLSNQLK